MIEIRDGRIYFYNLHKPNIQTRDFECISAYVCSECKNLIRAYFVGVIDKDRLADYAESDKMKYAYEVGHSNGATWIRLQDSYNKECKWGFVTARGVKNGVKAFLKRHNSAVMDEVRLADAIEKGMVGFKIVPDVVGRDAPVLMYNEDDMIDGKGLTFDEKWKRKEKIGEYLDSRLQPQTMLVPVGVTDICVVKERRAI